MQTSLGYAKHQMKDISDLADDYFQGVYLYRVAVGGCTLEHDSFELLECEEYFDRGVHTPLDQFLMPSDFSWCGCSHSLHLYNTDCYIDEHEV